MVIVDGWSGSTLVALAPHQIGSCFHNVNDSIAACQCGNRQYVSVTDSKCTGCCTGILCFFWFATEIKNVAISMP
jgi:hypothetical protein